MLPDALDERSMPMPPARPLTFQDLPAIVAALVQTVGDVVMRILSSLDAIAGQVAKVMTRLLGESSTLLDFLAEAADRGLIWVGSEEGQQALESIDFALIGTRTAEFYGCAGVYRPLAPGLMRDALGQMDAGAPDDHERLLNAVGPGSENWDWICEGLLASPVLGERRVLVVEAIECIDHCLWGPAVTTLLQVIEGVISDESGVLGNMRVGRRLEEAVQGRSPVTLDEFGGMVALPALEVLDREIFAPREFATISIHDTQLNRHVILHGRTVGYGTRVNALRTLMLVVALAELFDGPVMLRASRRPAADPALVSDYGVLNGLREIGATRVATGRPIWRADRVLERRDARMSLPEA